MRINDVWDWFYSTPVTAATGPTLDGGKADFPRSGEEAPMKTNKMADIMHPLARIAALAPKMIDKASPRGRRVRLRLPCRVGRDLWVDDGI